MSALPIRRDYDGTWKIEGYEELSFSSEDDAESAAELALFYYVDRIGRDQDQEHRYREAAKRGLAPTKKSTAERA